MYVYVCPKCDSEIPKSLVDEEDQCPDCGRYVSFSEVYTGPEGHDGWEHEEDMELGDEDCD